VTENNEETGGPVHTTVLIQWAGNPPKYVVHVNSDLGRETLNAFLPEELERIGRSLREDPIQAEDGSEVDLFDLADAFFPERSVPYEAPVASLTQAGD
jgi:hypothetical protein